MVAVIRAGTQEAEGLSKADIDKRTKVSHVSCNNTKIHTVA